MLLAPWAVDLVLWPWLLHQAVATDNDWSTEGQEFMHVPCLTISQALDAGVKRAVREQQPELLADDLANANPDLPRHREGR